MHDRETRTVKCHADLPKISINPSRRNSRRVYGTDTVDDLVCSCDRSRVESRNSYLQGLFKKGVGNERATATSQRRQPRQHNLPICRVKASAGATGLEPATSGVTGRVGYRDD